MKHYALGLALLAATPAAAQDIGISLSNFDDVFFTSMREGMAEEALKVDAAWISTIHGMCARILRTHAVELGLDPAFGIVGDAERADLVAESIDEALGADRVALAFLCEAYDEEVVGQDKNGKDDVRVVMRLHPALAPFKAAVLPLSKKLGDKAREVYAELVSAMASDLADGPDAPQRARAIGRRCRVTV